MRLDAAHPRISSMHPAKIHISFMYVRCIFARGARQARIAPIAQRACPASPLEHRHRHVF